MKKQDLSVKNARQVGKYNTSKLWLTMGVTSVALGITALANPSQLTAKAEATDSTSQKAPANDALTGNSTTLKASTSTSAAEPEATEASSDIATSVKQSTDSSTPAKPTTDTGATTTGESTKDATSSEIAKPDETTAKTATQVVDPKVTNLGDATSGEIAATKVKATADFERTGVAQTITAVSPASVEEISYPVLFMPDNNTVISQSTLKMTSDEFNNGSYDKPELTGYYTTKTISQKGVLGAQSVIGGNLYPGTFIEADVVPLSKLINIYIKYSNGKTATTQMTISNFLNYKYTPGDIVDQNFNFPGYKVDEVTPQPVGDGISGTIDVQLQSKYSSDTESFRSAYFIGKLDENNLVTNGIGTTDYFNRQTPLVQIPNILDTLSVINEKVPDATLNLDNSKITFTLDGVAKDLTFNDYFKQVLGVDLSASDADLKAVEQKTEDHVANADSLSKVFISKITANGALEQAYQKAITTHNPLDVYDFLARASVAFSTDTMQVGGTSSDWYTQYVLDKPELPSTDSQVKTEVGDAISVNPEDYYDNTKNNGNDNPTTDQPTAPITNNDSNPTTPTTNNQTTPDTNVLPSDGSSNGSAIANTSKPGSGTTENGTSEQESENGTAEENATKGGNVNTLSSSNQVANTTNHIGNTQKLPQTHEASDRMTVTVGSMLLVLATGLLGLGFKRRKQTKQLINLLISITMR